jgi:hypothetical protein
MSTRTQSDIVRIWAQNIDVSRYEKEELRIVDSKRLVTTNWYLEYAFNIDRKSFLLIKTTMYASNTSSDRVATTVFRTRR